MGKLCSHTSYSVETLDLIIYEIEYSDYDAFRELTNQKKATLNLDKSWHRLAGLLVKENNFIGKATIYGYSSIEHDASYEHYFSHLTNQDLKRTVNFIDDLKIIVNYENFKKLYFNFADPEPRDEDQCKYHYQYLSELHKFHKECIRNGYGVLIQIV